MGSSSIGQWSCKWGIKDLDGLFLCGAWFFPALNELKKGQYQDLKLCGSTMDYLEMVKTFMTIVYERDNAWRFPMDVRSGTSILSLKDL